jgi:hypothetical protein
MEEIQKKKITTNEALDEFYRLKNLYETNYYEKYIKPIIKAKISKKEKRIEFSKLPKNECINCKRQVGTIFNISGEEDFASGETFFKKYIAKCGDIVNPCPLDIQIQYAVRVNLESAINEQLTNVDKYKLNIIKHKNNILFTDKMGSENQILFEDLVEKLKDSTSTAGYLIELNILKNHNPEKKSLLKKQLDEFGKQYIIPFKNAIKKYNESDDISVINNSIKFYVEDMLPKLEEIRRLKYAINAVDYVEFYKEDKITDDVYILRQRENTFENDEHYIEDDDKVFEFVKGMKKERVTKKTRKNTEVITKIKTRKIKKLPEIILEDDNNDDNNDNNDNDNKDLNIYNKQYVLPDNYVSPPMAPDI